MFEINGIEWNIQAVNNNDKILIRPNGTQTIGVTDFKTKTIYFARSLRGALLEKVLLHEICHCIVFSYGLQWNVEDEERLCDFVATYFEKIENIAERIQNELVAEIFLKNDANVTLGFGTSPR